MRRTITLLVCAIAFASCSAPMPPGPFPGVAGPPQGFVVGVAGPDLACPVAGRTYTRGKSSAKLESRTALAGLSMHVRWTVVFSNQPSSSPPLEFVPKMFACGAPAGKKPVGTVRDAGGGSTRSECANGVCTVTVSYEVVYTPPNKLPSNKPWKYDLVRFDPSQRMPPYGVLPGVLIEVKKTP